MQYRPLGETGLSVSEIGFGGGGIGGVYGATTDDECIATVERALELGVNFFDVAPIYGDGQAERMLGRGLGSRRKDVLVETKVSVPIEAFPDVGGFVRRSLEESLTLLGTDHVDCFNLHNSMASVRNHPPLTGETVFITAKDALAIAEVFQELRDEGLARFLGFTSWRCTREALVELYDSGMFDVTLAEFSALQLTGLYPSAPGQDVTALEDMEALPEVDMAAYRYRPIDQHLAIKLAREAGLGVICMRPLAGGVLSGGFDRPDEPGTFMGLVTQRAAALGFITGDDPNLMPEAALRFSLAAPEISTVLIGAKNVAEIEAAVHAAEQGPLDAALVERVVELARTDYGFPA